MRPSEGHFQPNVILEDRALAQLIFALGITSLSAGSKTEPGGYFTYPQALEQFHISDERTPEEVADSIRQKGYEPVWKDWDGWM